MKLARLLPLRSFLHNDQPCRHCVRYSGHITRSLNVSVAYGWAKNRLVHVRSVEIPNPTYMPPLRTLSTPPVHPMTLVDPSRPSLFYHLLPAPNPVSEDLPAYAVSLFHRPPKDPQSPAVMGWLPAAAVGEGEQEAGLGDFKENANFLDLVHVVIQKAIEDGTDERLKNEAIQLNEGWMHINDDRKLPEMGRIGSPDNIISSVRVEAGEMLPETYSPMPAYRTCTADGLTMLSEGLEHQLLEELRRREYQ